MERRPRLALAVLCLAVMAVACGGDADDEAAPLADIDRGPEIEVVVAEGEPLVVGVSSALTGPIAQRGSEYRDAVVVGVQLWQEQNGELLLGHPIEVQAEDDACSEPGASVVAAQRHLARAGLVGVIGPQCSGGTAAALPLYGEAGVVAISGSATRTDLTTDQPGDGFFFRTAFRNDLEGTFIAIFILETIEAETVYVIDDSSLFGVDLADAAAGPAEAAGVNVIRESISRGMVDFGDLAARVAAAEPELVAFSGANPEAALLVRQLRDAGYTGLFGAGDAAASTPNFIEPVGEAAEGALFSGCRYPISDAYMDDFVELHGHQPTETFVAQYIDATVALLNAVNLTATDRDGALVFRPTELRDALRSLELTDGATGSFAFDERGDRVPKPGDDLAAVVAAGTDTGSGEIFENLGLIPCQVQDGELILLGGPGTEDNEIRLP
jgi:branched-chain amino acid transport system substrate-binding protein